MSASPPKPVPRAVIMVWISLLDKTLSILAFSAFITFPLNGKIAWYFLFLPCFADPPAESPSTKYSSLNDGSYSEQSASLPGSAEMSNTFFLLTSSLAFFAASLALAAFSAFCIIVLAILGFCSKKSVKDSDIIESHIPLISPFPSFVFVCPSNCGSGTLIDRIAVNPSLTSSLQM